MQTPVFRFAPSPNGHLHLGHAFSAMLNFRAAKALDGRFLVRIEDIDKARCSPQLEADMLEDLEWLGLSWETPVFRQSEHFETYASALRSLEKRGLIYRAYLTRGEIKRFVATYEASGEKWPRDPDGAPLYPGDDAVLSPEEENARKDSDAAYALRLNMGLALQEVGSNLSWWEGPSEWFDGAETADSWYQGQRVLAEPADWGDVILARKDVPTSYHLSVVLDDARQDVSDVLRGRDLYHATSVHRLLQSLLRLPEPRYRHHRLVLGEDGRKLSKSRSDASLRELDAEGVSSEDLFRGLALSK
ncbi:tRNA glutamyl-Q(34) synthetase GluQRS [Roseibium algae]|uniref:tRNA glutamyl-Q(34) synthetase GluQRS n=1 Tax=Roseibium algae TaxID=3123038 RepID=A0ABU8TQE8_9HYPH